MILVFCTKRNCPFHSLYGVSKLTLLLSPNFGGYCYIAENLLAEEFLPVRQELYARYTKFLKKLKKSPSYEVMMLARITTSDLQSTTGTNIMTIHRELGMDPTSVSSRQVRQMDLKRPVPERDLWRLATIENLLKRRRDLQTSLSDTSDIDFVISGLCTT